MHAWITPLLNFMHGLHWGRGRLAALQSSLQHHGRHTAIDHAWHGSQSNVKIDVGMTRSYVYGKLCGRRPTMLSMNNYRSKAVLENMYR